MFFDISFNVIFLIWFHIDPIHLNVILSFIFENFLHAEHFHWLYCLTSPWWWHTGCAGPHGFQLHTHTRTHARVTALPACRLNEQAPAVLRASWQLADEIKPSGLDWTSQSRGKCNVYIAVPQYVGAHPQLGPICGPEGSLAQPCHCTKRMNSEKMSFHSQCEIDCGSCTRVCIIHYWFLLVCTGTLFIAFNS